MSLNVAPRAGLLLACFATLAVAVGACGRGGPTTIQRRNEAMIAANRRMVDPCAIPTRAELREQGMPTKPYAHTVTFLNNVCRWGDDELSVSIEAVRALSKQQRYFDTHDDGPAMVGGAERAVTSKEYVGPAAAGSWGRSIIARNDRAIVTVSINHKPEGIDPMPILSAWATRTLAKAR